MGWLSEVLTNSPIARYRIPNNKTKYTWENIIMDREFWRYEIIFLSQLCKYCPSVMLYTHA
jgi:hypothetical protein